MGLKYLSPSVTCNFCCLSWRRYSISPLSQAFNRARLSTLAITAAVKDRSHQQKVQLSMRSRKMREIRTNMNSSQYTTFFFLKKLPSNVRQTTFRSKVAVNFLDTLAGMSNSGILGQGYLCAIQVLTYTQPDSVEQLSVPLKKKRSLLVKLGPWYPN